MKNLQPKILLLFLVGSLLVFGLDKGKLIDGPKAVAYAATTPGQYLVYSVKLTFNDWFSFLTFWKSGEARIKNLEQRNLELTVAKNKAEALEKENAELRKQLGVTKLVSRKQLPAVVLGLARYLEIGAGLDQGVKVGQTVVYGDNLIGQVVQVSGSVSFVQLPRDPESKVAIRMGAARGLANGEFNSKVKITQVAQNEEIRIDDLVLTTGEGGYLPDLVVGKVGKISTDGTGLFKEAEAVPLVDVSKLAIVYVILE